MTEPSMAMAWETTSFVLVLDELGFDRMRVRMRIVRGSVERFAVQYETSIEGDWHPVVRYDCAHGFAHRDRLDRQGRNIEKLYLGLDEQYAEIVNAAIYDIRIIWRSYRASFIRGPQ